MKKFKKCMALAMSAVMCACAVTPAFTNAGELTGDVDGDGKLTIVDAYTILNYYAVTTTLNTYEEARERLLEGFIYSNYHFEITDEDIDRIEKNCDMNSDGMINSQDCAEITTLIGYRQGDVNSDGIIDVSDAQAVLDVSCYMANKDSENPYEIVKEVLGYDDIQLQVLLIAGDADTDAWLDAMDASAILMKTDFKMGDVNCDGSINASDASAVMSKYNEMSSSGETEIVSAELLRYDYNMDGVVDSSDASEILSAYVGKSTR